jgi:multimeric flavodoxin WrbA
MKKKKANRILGVIGSPRKKGNTHILVSRILDGSQEKGALTEILFLNDLHIRECDGCHVCWKGKKCSKKDDMNKVYPKIMNSDVIIFGTPVYWYGPTALMKCFVDRFVYFNCSVPFEEENPKTAHLLVQFFKKSIQYLEMNLIGTILAPGVSKRGDILAKDDLLEKGYKLGKKIAQYRKG